ncbi:MAG: DNA polymerase III subunit delta [Calditrichia bacterium]
MSKILYYSNLMQDLKRGKVAPVYLLFGEEVLLAERAVEQICQTFIGKIDREINYFIRYASEGGLDPVLGLTAGMGLFSDRKVILLKEAQQLKQGDLKRLTSYLKNPSENVCLILQTQLISLFQSRLKGLENILYAVNIQPLQQNELVSFLQAEFKLFGKEITPDGADLMIFLVGNQLADLKNQVALISNYFEEKSLITPEDVEQIAAVYAGHDVFEFCKRVGQRDLKNSIFLLNNLIDGGVNIQLILSQLHRHFTILWQILGFYRAGVRNQETIARQLRIYPRYFKEYAAQAGKWKSSQIRQVLEYLHEADRNSRDSGANPKILLDILNYRIITC